jgi:hypothetical protein
MNEDYVVIYEFEMTLEEFNENKNKVFPINEVLTENGIISHNEFEVATAKNVIGVTVSDRSPNTQIIIKVLVDRNYEQQALEIINNQTIDEEPEELKNYEPIDEDE